MAGNRSSVFANLPIVGHVRNWKRGDSDSRAPDDGQALLQDDPLSIPLEDARSTTKSPSRSPVRSFAVVQEAARSGLQGRLVLGICSRRVAAIVVSGLAIFLAAFLLLRPGASSQGRDGLLPCGGSWYTVDTHTCYEGNFLCPVVDRQRTVKCGDECYLPRKYSCDEGQLVETQRPESAVKTPQVGADNGTCPSSYLHLSDPPYENYFISDCSSASQVVVTSPLADSDPSIISPRLLIAWPAGNSGVVVYFSPASGVYGNLGISLETLPNANRTLDPLVGGIMGILSFSAPATLDLAILGSIRTIRQYVEGPGTLVPEVQNAIKIQRLPNGGVQYNRMWFDKTTETFLTFQSTDDSALSLHGHQVRFEKGSYIFNGWFSYPQLDQMGTLDVFNPESQAVISQNLEEAESLSFLSYSSKLLAGAWRFLTYFGRDSLISLLLLQPVLSEGKGGAIEAIIGAAIERIDSGDGSVCHEETIGDFATYLNQQQGIDSSDPQCDYKMVDTDFFLPIAMNQYLVESVVGQSRRDAFMDTKASVMRSNQGRTYNDLALATAEKIMRATTAFEQSPVKENMIHLQEGQGVGQWRDSGNGLGGGRVPYDVNTALAPAALKAIASLSSSGLFASHPEWAQTASKRAVFWEDNTLAFFQVDTPVDEARTLVDTYVRATAFPGKVDTDELTTPVRFYGLALEGKNHQPLVKVMNTDDCFRLYLLDSTNQTQLSEFLSQAADNILRPFPLGLSTSVGLLVANPAYAAGSVDTGDFTTSSYHGTVVWGWQLAMMAAGLERQLGRCDRDLPDFCADTALHGRLLEAYNHLWDVIDRNREHLSNEVWSWVFDDADFRYTPLGALPPPKGQSPVESDIRQLWSLTFLAVKRNGAYALERLAK